MEFAGAGLLVLFHVLFATLWFGGAAYQVLVIGRTLAAAGPHASGFAVALARRGGIGKYFAVTGGLTILFGAALYGHQQVYADAFAGRNLWLTLGAIMALLTYAHGLTANLPTERKWIDLCTSLKGAPTQQQQQQMQDLGMKLGRLGTLSAGMLASALLLMLMGRVLA